MIVIIIVFFLNGYLHLCGEFDDEKLLTAVIITNNVQKITTMAHGTFGHIQVIFISVNVMTQK